MGLAGGRLALLLRKVAMRKRPPSPVTLATELSNNAATENLDVENPA